MIAQGNAQGDSYRAIAILSHPVDFQSKEDRDHKLAVKEHEDWCDQGRTHGFRQHSTQTF